MKRSIATITIALSALAWWLIWPAGARAEPLRQALIDARARWVVHLDLEAVRGSSTGKLLLNHTQVVGEFIQPMREDLGIDPATDLASLTIYAPEPDAQQSVTLLLTDDDTTQRMIESLRNAQPQTFEMQSEEAGLVCTWKVRNKRWRLAVRADPADGAIGDQRRPRIVILAQRSPALQDAVEVIEGKRASLARGPADNDARAPGVLLAVHPLEPEAPPPICWPLSEPAAGPAGVGAGETNIGILAGAGPTLVRAMGCVGGKQGPWSRMGAGVEGFNLALHEERDESGEACLAVSLHVRAADAQHAERLEGTFCSIAPLLNPMQDDQAQVLKAILDSLRTQREDREVRIDVRMPHDDLQKLLNRRVQPEAKPQAKPGN